MAKKPKTYEIKSFEQLVNVVNRDNMEAITTDLLMWLMYCVQFYEEARKLNPDLKDKTNWELSKCHFIWIDDGKHDMKETKIILQETGEQTCL
jgi:hypothetical protein